MNFRLRKRGQSRKRARTSDLGFVTAVDQLERLSEKFNFANTAVAELEVAFFVVAGEQLVLDAQLHMAQFIDCGVVEIAAINERLNFLEKRCAKRSRRRLRLWP